jgi:hypothetical protein
MVLPTPVSTSWVMIEHVSQHDGGDPQVGIGELAVNAASATLAPRRTNVARGRTVTRRGTGWNNVNGSLTDNILASANTQLSTSMFNSNPTAEGVSLDVDLGSPMTLTGIGLAENDYGGAGGRQLIETARLEFANDPSFATISATRDLALANIPYQVVDFDAATGRYVRLSFQSQYPNNDANLGFTELQLFQVPEPGMLGLVFGLPLILSRWRRARGSKLATETQRHRGTNFSLTSLRKTSLFSER